MNPASRNNSAHMFSPATGSRFRVDTYGLPPSPNDVFFEHEFSDSSYSGDEDDDSLIQSTRRRSDRYGGVVVTASERTSAYPTRTTRNSLASSADLLEGLPMQPRADMVRNSRNGRPAIRRKRMRSDDSSDDDVSDDDDDDGSFQSFSDGGNAQIDADEKLARRLARQEARDTKKSTGRRGRPPANKKSILNDPNDSESVELNAPIKKYTTRGWGTRNGLRTIPIDVQVDRDICHSDVITESQYYPQLGDIVMYLAQGHSVLLQVIYNNCSEDYAFMLILIS